MNNKFTKTCLLCSMKYSTQQALSLHINRSHKISFKYYYDKFLKKEDDGICKTCNKETRFSLGKYRLFCSTKCSTNNPEIRKKIQETSMERYGTINPCKNKEIREKLVKSQSLLDFKPITAKRKKTCLKRYGVDNPSKSKEIIAKIESIHRKNWGCKSSAQHPLVIEKRKKTCLKRYGVDCYLKTPEVLEKRKKTCLKRYGCEHASQNKEIKEKTLISHKNYIYNSFKKFQDRIIPMFTIEEFTGCGYDKDYKWKCVKCGKVFQCNYADGRIPRCYTCYPKLHALEENKLFYFISSLGVTIDRNRRNLKGKELDVYIPEKKIAIEYDGIYWHGETVSGKDSTYHLNKTIECEKKGIKLIHIFEDEWLNKKEIVKSRLKHILNKIKYSIGARQCTINIISIDLKNKFLNKYHLQGEDKSAIHLGAFYKNRLVAVMTFSKLRKALGQNDIKNSWELSRFATIKNFTITGIANKILSHFEKTYKPTYIISYADRRWSKGNLYYKLGFKMDHISNPSYWYLKAGIIKRIHRFNFRKNVLKDKLDVFDPTKTEWENMQNNKYDRIWDCGNYVFIKTY